MADLAARCRIDDVPLFRAHGVVTRVLSGHVEANGPLSNLGALCRIEIGQDSHCIAEVSAVGVDRLVLVPLDSTLLVRPGNRVTELHGRASIPTGDAFIARVVDGLGRPVDDKGPLTGAVSRRINDRSVSVLDRISPNEPIETGVRVIDGLMTIGVGQRVGIFAASGVGKTRLMEQLARQIVCDHVIICQVGERGREVEALWSSAIQGRNASHVTLVAATSDETAPMRVRAVEQALGLADHWREQGRHVVLIIDSVTRLAMALREIGLASGEPPTLRAYTPNVLKALPRLVERCGKIRSGGAITAIFTVLAETDDVDDPIVEVMKSLLDGHIMLSRTLAQSGHFPAVDVLKSISRLASSLMSTEQHDAAKQVAAMLARYDEVRVLVESGLYTAGSNSEIDTTIAVRPAILDFLKQGSDERVGWDAMSAVLYGLSAKPLGERRYG